MKRNIFPSSLRFVLGAVCFVTALVAAAPARAQDGAPVTTSSSPPVRAGGPFGQAGQWVYSISGPEEFPFWLKKTGDGAWNLVLRPSIDTFLISSVSVGGIVSLAKDGDSSDVGVGARAGYNLGISSLVSFWARAGVYFHHWSSGPNSGNETIFEVKAPFLFHVVPHAFVGAGPFFSMPVQNSDSMAGKDATYGLTAIVGGWI